MEDNRKKGKKLIAPIGERKKIFERKIEDLELKNKLLGSPELFIKDKGSDEYLDSLSLRISFNGGRELTLEEYINENYVEEYNSHFYQSYYDVIGKLYGLPENAMKGYIKPIIAADFTLKYVYGRFPNQVLKRLKDLTGWSEIPGVRIHKLFQRLHPIAIEQLDLFIDQAYDVANKSKDITEFKMEFSKKYKIYFQLDMFTDKSI